MYIYVAISNRQRKNKAQALFLNPFQHLLIMQTEVFSFVRLLTKKQSYPFANGLNGQQSKQTCPMPIYVR
jgi:hypothetical protein